MTLTVTKKKGIVVGQHRSPINLKKFHSNQLFPTLLWVIGRRCGTAEHAVFVERTVRICSVIKIFMVIVTTHEQPDIYTCRTVTLATSVSYHHTS